MCMCNMNKLCSESEVVKPLLTGTRWPCNKSMVIREFRSQWVKKCLTDLNQSLLSSTLDNERQVLHEFYFKVAFLFVIS